MKKNIFLKKQNWYQQSFGDLYPLIYSHRNFEAAQHEIMKLKKWAPLNPSDTVLDVCCGNGRHLKAILEIGCNAVGFDLSAELTFAAAELTGFGNRVFRADILHIPTRTRFDRVLNLFTSFGYFSDKENYAAFQEMSARVKKNGVLILDHMNAGKIRRTLVRESIDEKEGYRIIQQRRIDGKRVKKVIKVSKNDQYYEFYENVRMYEPEDMIKLAKSAGFKGVTFHGNFAGDDFEPDSERMIMRFF